MIQFYAPDIESTLTLPQSGSQHCVRVLRMGAGDEIEVIDGRGHRFRCVIVDPHPKHAAVDILACEDMPLSWSSHITLAVAPTKHMDRMEWMVEKLTEIGVNRIVPLLCRRSERKEIKTDRLEKIAVSAMKQSLKATLPIIDGMTRLREILEKATGINKYAGYCDESLPRIDFTESYVPRSDTLILIGPEGDFSPTEIKMAIDMGVTPVTFGKNRLRTETAALYGLTACHILDDSQ